MCFSFFLVFSVNWLLGDQYIFNVPWLYSVCGVEGHQSHLFPDLLSEWTIFQIPEDPGISNLTVYINSILQAHIFHLWRRCKLILRIWYHALEVYFKIGSTSFMLDNFCRDQVHFCVRMEVFTIANAAYTIVCQIWQYWLDDLELFVYRTSSV